MLGQLGYHGEGIPPLFNPLLFPLFWGLPRSMPLCGRPPPGLYILLFVDHVLPIVPFSRGLSVAAPFLTSGAVLVVVSFWVELLLSVSSMAVVKLHSSSRWFSDTFTGILSPVTVPSSPGCRPLRFPPGLSGSLSPVSRVAPLRPSSFLFHFHLHGAWFALQM